MNVEERPQILKTPWHKTGAGKTFLIILTSLFILGLIFLSFVGYYVFQITQGKGQELAQEFSQEFKIDPALASNIGSAQAHDVQPFIRAPNPSAGDANAPVTITMFIDFECPYSQKSYPIFKKITEQFGPAIRVIFKHFPLESMHPNTRAATYAAACAAEQDKFWDYYDTLFQKKRLDNLSLVSYATKLNLDINRFERCIQSEKYKGLINQDLLDGIELGLRGTPTYFINNRKVEGALPADAWTKLILEAMQE